MSINGRHDGFELDDLLALGRTSGLKRTRTRALVVIEDIDDAVGNRRSFASEAGIGEHIVDRIEKATGVWCRCVLRPDER